MKRAPTLPPDREHLDPAKAQETDGAAPAAPDGAKSKTRRGHDYEVGYGRPPKAKRWTPGQSGNPGGRPKSVPDLRTAFKQVLAETVEAIVDGEPVRLTIQQALLMKLRDLAASGDRAAVKMVDQLAAAAPKPALEGDSSELRLEMIGIRMERRLKARAVEGGPDDASS